ncbi:MAG: L-lactate dehydrogenase, partial [Clostridia bacterium]|nr:L-lactate dehydrogenase [Clostridia bacterium]
CNKIFEDIIPNIYNSGFKGIYIIASNPLDVMCRICLKYAKTSSTLTFLRIAIFA